MLSLNISPSYGGANDKMKIPENRLRYDPLNNLLSQNRQNEIERVVSVGLHTTLCILERGTIVACKLC